MKHPKCLCGCGRPPHSRGLCHASYVAATTLIKSGKTTWATLERKGKSKPKAQTGPKSNRAEWLLSK